MKNNFIKILALAILLFALLIICCGCDADKKAVIFVDNIDIYACPGESGSIMACLKYEDGHFETADFVWESSNPNVAVRNNGDYYVDSNARVGEVVNVVITYSNGQRTQNLTVKITIIEPSAHAINLNYNNGQIDESITVVQGDIVVLPNASLDNYEFDGWYILLNETSSLETSSRFVAGNNFLLDHDVNLIARYSAMLVLDDDMGTSNEFRRVHFNENLPCSLPVLEPKNGWTFAGWYTQKGGQGEKYEGTNDVFEASEPKLYAKWTTTANLNYISNGINKVENINKSAVEIVYNKRVEGLPENITYTNSAYAFNGWLIANGHFIRNNDIYIGNAIENLYETANIDLTLNYGNSESEVFRAVVGCTFENAGVELPVRLMDHWQFGGFYTEEFGEGEKLDRQTIYNEFEQTQYYATWSRDIELHSCIFGDETDLLSLKVIYGVNTSLRSFDDMGAWSFVGWFPKKDTIPSSENQRVENVETFVESFDAEQKLDLYSVWKADEILIDLRSDSASATVEKLENVYYGISLPKQNINLDATFEGFDFAGWFADDSFSQEIDVEGTPCFPLDCTILYARWSKQIAVETNGGDVNLSSIIAFWDEELPTTDENGYTLVIPSKDGFVFDGYYIDGTRYYSSNMKRLVNNWQEKRSDIVLVAHWIDEYKCYWYDYDGRELHSAVATNKGWFSEQGYSVEYDVIPTRESDENYDYEFVCWRSTANKTFLSVLDGEWYESKDWDSVDWVDYEYDQEVFLGNEITVSLVAIYKKIPKEA